MQVMQINFTRAHFGLGTTCSCNNLTIACYIIAYQTHFPFFQNSQSTNTMVSVKVMDLYIKLMLH